MNSISSNEIMIYDYISVEKQAVNSHDLTLNWSLIIHLYAYTISFCSLLV